MSRRRRRPGPKRRATSAMDCELLQGGFDAVADRDRRPSSIRGGWRRTALARPPTAPCAVGRFQRDSEEPGAQPSIATPAGRGRWSCCCATDTSCRSARPISSTMPGAVRRERRPIYESTPGRFRRAHAGAGAGRAGRHAPNRRRLLCALRRAVGACRAAAEQHQLLTWPDFPSAMCRGRNGRARPRAAVLPVLSLAGALRSAAGDRIPGDADRAGSCRPRAGSGCCARPTTA